jgi:hypothetical protein
MYYGITAASVSILSFTHTTTNLLLATGSSASNQPALRGMAPGALALTPSHNHNNTKSRVKHTAADIHGRTEQHLSIIGPRKSVQ